jgi:Gamma-glutamyl cyclotransferase, AIG2-like
LGSGEKMDSEPPRDYELAKNNMLSEEEVDGFLQKPGSSTRFVYGALMLPTVLKYYIHMDQSMDITKNMTQATLFGYKLYCLTESGSSPRLPVIAPSSDPTASVEGMLIFDLNEDQRNAIYDFEAGLMELASVNVEICQRNSENLRSLRIIEPVGAFVWQGPKEGLIPTQTHTWDISNLINTSFYDNIVRSQNAECAESHPSSRESLPDQGSSAPSHDQGNSNSRRWRASLGQILEEREHNSSR